MLVKISPDFFSGITGSLQKVNDLFSSKIYEKRMVFEELQCEGCSGGRLTKGYILVSALAEET